MTDVCQCPSGSRCDGHGWSFYTVDETHSFTEEEWEALMRREPEPDPEAVSPREEWVSAWTESRAAHR